MNSSNSNEIFDRVSSFFPPDSKERRVCSYVLQRLCELKNQFTEVNLASVADALGWMSDGESKAAIARSLDYLVYGDFPLLERKFRFWPAEDSGQVLDDYICDLSELDVRLALEANVLIDPTTGEEILEFLDRITVLYEVSEFAHSLVETGQGVKS
jgi:hypothetical protein